MVINRTQVERIRELAKLILANNTDIGTRVWAGEILKLTEIIPIANVPNLDAMSVEQLKEFYLRYRNGYPHKDIFPRGGEGTIRALRNLASYAKLKAIAVRYRTDGQIGDALRYEEEADIVYRRLPDWARW